MLKDNLPGSLDTEKGITISPALPDGTTKINNFPFIKMRVMRLRLYLDQTAHMS